MHLLYLGSCLEGGNVVRWAKELETAEGLVSIELACSINAVLAKVSHRRWDRKPALTTFCAKPSARPESAPTPLPLAEYCTCKYNSSTRLVEACRMQTHVRRCRGYREFERHSTFCLIKVSRYVCTAGWQLMGREMVFPAQSYELKPQPFSALFLFASSSHKSFPGFEHGFR